MANTAVILVGFLIAAFVVGCLAFALLHGVPARKEEKNELSAQQKINNRLTNSQTVPVPGRYTSFLGKLRPNSVAKQERDRAAALAKLEEGLGGKEEVKKEAKKDEIKNEIKNEEVKQQDKAPRLSSMVLPGPLKLFGSKD